MAGLTRRGSTPGVLVCMDSRLADTRALLSSVAIPICERACPPNCATSSLLAYKQLESGETPSHPVTSDPRASLFRVLRHFGAEERTPHRFAMTALFARRTALGPGVHSADVVLNVLAVNATSSMRRRPSSPLAGMQLNCTSYFLAHGCGGYLENEARLSDVALNWLLAGASLIPGGLKHDGSVLRLSPNPAGPQHNELAGPSREHAQDVP